jgi:menaquinone-9 beta-reductase
MTAYENHFDVIIVGAGPAGCTTAIRLAQSGLKIALIDKSKLPQEKVCGDALSGTVIKILQGFPGNAINEFLMIDGMLPSWGIRFVAPSQEKLDIPFVQNRNELTPAPGFVYRRYDFESFLVRQLQKNLNITLIPESKVTEIEYSLSQDRIVVSAGQTIFTSKVIVGADGVNSIVGRKLAGNKLNLSQFCLGARGYYQGVTELHPDNFIELHFIEELLPSYLWIFPMHGGIANVGLGMMHKWIRRTHNSPDKKLEEIIHSHPVLKERFANATLLGKVETHGLPLGPDKKRISGTRFLLTGDAASLIDPFTGEGIGNAMISGKIAAKFIHMAFEKNDFSEDCFRGYKDEINTKIGNELKTSATIRKLVSFPGLFNFVVKEANKRETLRTLFSSMYTNPEARKNLLNPLFYLRMVTDPLYTSSSYKP